MNYLKTAKQNIVNQSENRYGEITVVLTVRCL